MEYIQLKEIVDIYLGLTHTPKYVEEGIPFLSVKDISDGKIDFSNCHYITEEEYKSLPKGARPQKGDMLFCRIGTIGKPIIIDENIRNFGSFVSLGFFRKKNNEYLLEYLKYWMNSQLFEKQVKQNVKGVAQINLNTGWLKEFIVPKKNVNEQIVIINQLDIIQETIDIRKKQIEQLDELIKSQFVEMFLKNEFPKEKLENNVEEMFIGPFGSALKNECFVEENNGYCVVYEQKHAIYKNIEDFRWVDKDKYESLKRFNVQPKDIIVSCRGTIGKTFVIPENAPLGIMHPSIMKIRLKKEKYIPEFFEMVLQHYFLEKENQTNGATIKMGIKASTLEKEDFIIPDMELQIKYLTFVKQIDKQKFEIQKNLEEIQRLQESLMNKYFG